ncbi:MAG: nitrilase-related carbon-nitrogen hydrolase [Rhodospirillaceae bacterium]|nr:nitrilase-related carbon-nitrogen hydrolase [Rhodospirillaceae bacterium]
MKTSLGTWATGLVAACMASVMALGAHAQQSAPQLVRPDGTYPTVPLEKDVVVVKVVQNAPLNLQKAPTIQEGLKTNVERMAGWIKKACTTGKKPDFILFNEFPLTGYSSGPRSEKLKFTIRMDGPEVKRIGELAKECDTYIIFGSYATDPDWPGHILSLNPVIGRDGKVKETYWKTRNVTRLNDTEIPTTTIESVRDKFRAKYGIEEEFPVLKTEFGNIAVSTVQLDPFVFAAYTMRGVEIMMRTATLFSKIDVQAIALYNNVYSAMSNITFPPDSGVPASFGGQSLIVDNRGKVLAEDPSNNENVVEAEIPIKKFREGRRIQRYPLEVVKPVFDQYKQEVPLNIMDVPIDQLPQTDKDMKDFLDRKSRWLNPAGQG